jgi:predicted amidohydrolase YtcJ
MTYGSRATKRRIEMNENEFYVAIQDVMTKANELGWKIGKCHEIANDAADEWLSEMERIRVKEKRKESEK